MSEREQFEAWVLSEGYPRERLAYRVIGYTDDHIDDLWSGWEGRSASKQLDDKVTVARMGHGIVSVGGCYSTEIDEPGILFLDFSDIDDSRPIGADTSDIFPVGSVAPVDKTLAYISFANAESIDLVIDTLRGIKAEHFGDDTAHLLSTEANAERLRRSVADFAANHLTPEQAAKGAE